MQKFYIINQQKRFIENQLNKNTNYKIKNIKFLSFNGRTISFSFEDQNTKKKFFIKKILFLDKDYPNTKISSIIRKKYNLISTFEKNNLISYKTIKIKNSHNIFCREYINGSTLETRLQNLNSVEVNFLFISLIDYILKILIEMRKNKVFVNLDLKPDNIIFDDQNKINLIDLDLVYIDLDKKNFESFILAKFFFKISKIIDYQTQVALFNIIRKKISFLNYFKKSMLDRFFIKEDNKNFDHFIYQNYKYFKNLKISFKKKYSIKSKIIDTLSRMPKHSYIIARRYKWLINNDTFNSKDVDIICDRNKIEKIKKIFLETGWDVLNNKISQYFESSSLLVNIDLDIDTKNKFQLSFSELYKNSEKINGLFFINEKYYYSIIIKNSLKYKKYIKNDYYTEIQKYSNRKELKLNKDIKNFLNKKMYFYGDKIYFKKYDYLIRTLIDFLKYKDFVFIGADGAGKSTLVDIVNKNTSLFVRSKKKYLRSFFFPSGRTDMFFFRTSYIFKFLINIKQIFFTNLNKNNQSYKFKNLNKNNNRKLKTLKNPYIQTILILLIPLFILDSWIHKVLSYFNFNRIDVCDRYYDDILINYNNPYIRKFVNYFIPNSKYKFYLFASPEEHFERKKNEDIEMIVHMQKCYLENQKSVFKVPTNINKTLISKKILKILLSSL